MVPGFVLFSTLKRRIFYPFRIEPFIETAAASQHGNRLCVSSQFNIKPRVTPRFLSLKIEMSAMIARHSSRESSPVDLASFAALTARRAGPGSA